MATSVTTSNYRWSGRTSIISKKVKFSQWQTYLEENWENVCCYCPNFSKVYMCKHVIGSAMRLKYVESPIEAKAIPIEKKRKPGRLRKTRPAVQRQDWTISKITKFHFSFNFLSVCIWAWFILWFPLQTYFQFNFK